MKDRLLFPGLPLLISFLILALLCVATGTISQAQTLATIYKFCSEPGCSDGWWPTEPLLQASDGSLYGTTSLGQISLDWLAKGTFFKVSTSGTLTTLHTFCPHVFCIDGAGPRGLVEGNDGYFYGTTTG